VKKRGTDEASGSLFSYADLEARIPVQHPLRRIRQVVNEALTSLEAAASTPFFGPLLGRAPRGI